MSHLDAEEMTIWELILTQNTKPDKKMQVSSNSAEETSSS
jgi:hypothetical protein